MLIRASSKPSSSAKRVWPLPGLGQSPGPAIGIGTEQLGQFHDAVAQLVQRNADQRKRAEQVEPNLDTELAAIVPGLGGPVGDTSHERGERTHIATGSGLGPEPVAEADDQGQLAGWGFPASHRSGKFLPISGVAPDTTPQLMAGLAGGPLNYPVGVLESLPVDTHAPTIRDHAGRGTRIR